MNKSEMKSVMEQIADKLQGKKSVSFMAHQNKPQWRVLEELWKDGHKRYNFNGVHYNIMYNPSHATLGNRCTTSDFTVSRYSKKEHFDADEVLAKKEIEIRHFHGGTTKELESLGLDKPLPLTNVDDVTAVVEQLYEASDYNIMVQRHDTGDVTIWVDNGKFRQR